MEIDRGDDTKRDYLYQILPNKVPNFKYNQILNKKYQQNYFKVELKFDVEEMCKLIIVKSNKVLRENSAMRKRMRGR